MRPSRVITTKIDWMAFKAWFIITMRMVAEDF
jgi:hypothetical protein